MSLVGIVRQFESKLVRRRPDAGFDHFEIQNLDIIGLAAGGWRLVALMTPSAAFDGTSP
ncbi:MAG: hypothetical protein M3096_02365 [Actinomycetia bacterium]|nr:hypothetical protein [Actinomycetes bacterium]